MTSATTEMAQSTMAQAESLQTNPVRWRMAEAGLWVGNHDGCFAGTIDQHGTHYYVRNQFGEYLGEYAELTAAERALEAQLIPMPLSRQHAA